MASELREFETDMHRVRDNKSPAPGRLWAAGGFLLILLPTVVLMTWLDIGRQKDQSIQLLLEKGAALIRSFEAGTRTGMAHMASGVFRLQRLLAETAQQEDIVYLLVTDDQGRIIAHNDAGRVGARHGADLDLVAVAAGATDTWRIVSDAEGRQIFEVYRKFMPGIASVPEPSERHPGPMRHGPQMMRRWLEQNWRHGEPPSPERLVIFVGLDMRAVEAARSANTRHAAGMAVILLVAAAAGFAGLVRLEGYRAARTSLRRIRAFSERLVENLPVGLVALDRDGVVAAVNPAACDLLKQPASGMVGHPAAETLPAPLAALADRLGPLQSRLETEVSCPTGGGDHPLVVNAAWIADAEGADAGKMLLLKDLSEVRTLEAAVKRSERLAAIGSLAGGVAHEIRNPLSSLKGFATYFKQRSPGRPEDEKIATIMIGEVDRLNRVVGQLLELSRPVTVSPTPLPVRSVIEGAVAVVRPRAAEAGVNLDVVPSDDAPPVPMDPERMHQVLLNLLINAIEAMSEGGRLQVFVKTVENGIEIQVVDTGPGIGAEDLGHVFDPYFTTKSTGTGLGLAIVHSIIEAHGGTVAIDSRPGAGTTVRLRLPFSPLGGEHDRRA
jgi:two-component system, NtrC family, sensor histidine kinase HydH